MTHSFELNVSKELQVLHCNRPLSYSPMSLDRALFLDFFIRHVRSSGVRAFITIVDLRLLVPCFPAFFDLLISLGQ